MTITYSVSSKISRQRMNLSSRMKLFNDGRYKIYCSKIGEVIS